VADNNLCFSKTAHGVPNTVQLLQHKTLKSTRFRQSYSR